VTFYNTVPETSGVIMISIAMALFMLPFFFVSATDSNHANIFKKVNLFRNLQLIHISIALLAAYGIYCGDYKLLLASMFFYGGYTVVFSEVRHGIMCSALGHTPSAYQRQNIRLAALFGQLSGLIVTGAMIAFGNPATNFISAIILLIIPSISYFISFAIPLGLQSKNEPVSFNFKVITRSPLECWRRASKNRNTLYSLQGISWFWLLGAIFMSQLPYLTKNYLHCDAYVFIYLLSVFLVGIGVGTSLSNLVLKKEIGIHWVPTAMLIISIFSCDIAYLSIYNKFTGNLKDLKYFLSYRDGVNLTIDFFMLALAGGMYLVPLYRYLGLDSNRPYRSQMRAANNYMNAVFVATGSVITILFAILGIEPIFTIMILAVANFLTALYICHILPNTVVKNLFRTFFLLGYRIETIGLENLSRIKDKTLIIANHVSLWDPIIIATFIQGEVYFAAGEDLMKAWWLRPLIRCVKGTLINYNGPMALKTLIDLVKSGKQVVIFPEGRISVTGSLMKIYDGPGLIAEKAGASLMPIRIEGSQNIPFSNPGYRLKQKFFPKLKIVVSQVRSIDLVNGETPSSRERRHIVGDKIYDIMLGTMFEAEDKQQTLFGELLNARSKFGGSHLIFGDVNKTTLSYNSLVIASFALGNEIAKKTVAGERVGILLPNMCGTVATFFALIAYGRIPTMLNFSTGIKNMLACCNGSVIKQIYTAKAFIEAADLHPQIEALKNAGVEIFYLEDIKKKISILDKLSAYYKSLFAYWFYQKYTAKQNVSSKTPAIVLFTSGSEGAPKGVVLSHQNIIANFKQAQARIDVSHSDRLFNALPMFHSFGLTAGTILPLFSGVFTFLYPSPLHYRIIPEMIYNNNSTIFFGTDTFLSGYAKYAHPYDFFNIRYVFAGAEALRAETRKIWMDKFGIRIFEGYGATEAAPIISMNTPLHCKHNTAGRIMPGISWKLEKVPGISSGKKMLINGPNIMLGYLKTDNPGIIQPPTFMIDGKLEHGWYDTGDIVEVDEDHYVTIKGRFKRFAKIAGEMVSLPAIEEAINVLWPQFQNAAISISDPRKGEAVVIVTTNPEPLREDVANYFHQNGYAEILCPKKLIFMKEIPVLGTGKIDYVSIQEAVAVMESDANTWNSKNDQKE
jgi:acyl-[acyl-carrier-protein]-phospholipid O-acyltransferase/long-chain-fatty-acid--[acyl-carrier-protein] ligase